MKGSAKHWFALSILLAGMGIIAPGCVTAQVPTYTGVEITPGFVPVAVNASGQLAGNITNQSGFLRAALNSGGVITDLGVLSGGDRSEATGINDSGQIVGNSTKSGGLTHAFVYSGGVMIDMGTLPGGATSYATAINNLGQITGWSDTLQPATTFPRPDHAFIYSGGVMTDLGNISGGFGNFSAGYAINASGQVAGWSVNASFETHAFKYSGGAMSDLGTLGGSESRARGINDSGTVVGWSYTTGDLATHAFKSAGGMVDLGVLASNTASSATAINKDGTIVGHSVFNSTPAFVYTTATGMVKLDTMVTGPGWILGRASAINNAGQIVVSGSNAAVFATYFLLTPQPVAPGITLQPTNKTVTAGQVTSFTVAASGTPTPGFQWQLSSDSGVNWTNLANGGAYAGVTTTSLSVTTNIGLNAYRYRAVASNGTGSATSNSATLTVNPAPALSVADLSISEGNAGTKLATFTVTLSPVAAGPVTFDIATDYGTAAPGVDFVSASAAGLSIAAGQSSANFAVIINGDTAVEGNETFTVNLKNVVGAGVADAQAQGLIVNDDNAMLSIADATVMEGNSGSTTVRFLVSLNNPMPTTVSFDIGTSNGSATAGSDYVARSQLARVIDAGRTQAVFEVAVTGDANVEPDETFNVSISNVSGATLGDGAAVGTIQNDDAAANAPVLAAGESAGMPAATVVPQVFTNLHSFTGVFTRSLEGNTPESGVLLANDVLYGAAYGGGNSIRGTIYKLNANGSGFVVLHHFSSLVGDLYSNADGGNPSGELVLSGATLFGAAENGGAFGAGAVFSVNTDGTGFTTLYSFSERSGATSYLNSDGGLPGDLILSGSTLYGVAARGGTAGNGTLFAINTNGSGFVNLHNFTGADDGAVPVAGLLLSGSTLYGTAYIGGANGGTGTGTVFKLNTNGSGFTVLHTFSPITSGPSGVNSDGAAPYARLILSGSTLYGTARDGGTSGKGVIFAVNTDGTGFTNLHNFAGASDGASSISELVLSGNTLYGATSTGGPFGSGTLFSINTNGTGFVTLYSFPAATDYPPVNTDGAHPQAGLFLSGTTLYGTAFYGGSAGNGTVFSLALGYVSVAPLITAQPAGTTVTASHDASFSAAASGTPAPTLQWQVSSDSGASWNNLANGGAYSGVVSPTLTVNASVGLSGNQYRCVASNIDGSATSNAATLTVNPTDISIADVSVVEGNAGTKLATFTVNLSPVSASPVSFDIATDYGTAMPGVDFANNSAVGQSIAAGQTSATFSVTINGDTAVESNETFTVNLNNVVGANVLDGQALGTIVNDDSAGLSIADVSVLEGNSGTSTVRFEISLSSPMPTVVSFNIGTSDGTAMAGSDYVARNQVGRVMDAGRTRALFEVAVNGDSAVEPNESFNVTLSNVSGAALADGLAVGTIQNDDAAPLLISQIQGRGPMSAFAGQSALTEGVVTAITGNGFVIQSPDNAQDGDPATAEGLFVVSARDSVQVGDALRVSGRVQEAQIGDDPNQLTLTQLLAGSVTVISRGNALPQPMALNAGNAGPRQPVTGLERFEGMRVSLAQLSVVAPVGGTINDATGTLRSNGQFYAVAAGVPRPFREPGLSVLDRARAVAGVNPQPFDANPERLRVNSLGQRGAQALAADAGDSVRGMVGVLGYGDGAYQVLPDPSAQVTVVSGASPTAVSRPATDQVTIGSFSVRGLFDDTQTGTGPVRSTTAYSTRLAKTANAICAYAKSPDILGLAEVENEAGLNDLAAALNANDGNLLFPGSCQGSAGYHAHMITGTGPATLGFLVRTAEVRPGLARVEVLSVQAQDQAAGFRNRDGSSELLHEIPPLLLRARINGASTPLELSLLNARLSALEGNLAAPGNHGWATRGDYLRAKRAAQALSLAQLIQARQRANPSEKLVVLGNFQANEFNDGHADLLGVLTGREAAANHVLEHIGSPINPPLNNLISTEPVPERYTDIRDGNAQALSHILVNRSLLSAFPRLHLETARINADFGEDNASDASVPVRTGDSDPQVLYLP